MIVFSCCNAWDAVTGQPWGSDDCCHPPICVHGIDRGLLLRATIHHPEGQAVAAGGLPHCHHLSSRCLWHLLLPQFLHSRQTFQWGGSILHNDGTSLPLVLHITAISIFRILLWMSQTTFPTSSENQLHT